MLRVFQGAPGKRFREALQGRGSCSLLVLQRMALVHLRDIPHTISHTLLPLGAQELERVAAGAAQEEGGTAGAAGQAMGIDQARLALLHEELTSEHAALNLILEALREMKASMQPSAPQPPVPPAPSTPDK